MNKEKSFPLINNNKQEIKLYEFKSQSIKHSSILELSITKCPITCHNCKIVYSNKLTGIKIVCKCPCHLEATDHEELIRGQIKSV